MAIHVVMEPPGTDRIAVSTRAVLVRDAFSLPAFLVPFIWLLWHRLWIEAGLALAASAGLSVLGEMMDFGIAGFVLPLLVSIFIGLEGPALRIAALRRRGWREWGVVEAGNQAEAEIRYLAGEQHAPPDAEPRRPAQGAPAHPASGGPAAGPVPGSAPGPALGLLSYPGRR